MVGVCVTIGCCSIVMLPMSSLLTGLPVVVTDVIQVNC